MLFREQFSIMNGTSLADKKIERNHIAGAKNE